MLSENFPEKEKEKMERYELSSTFVEKDLNYYLRMLRGDFAELEESHPMKAMGPISQKNIVILLHSHTLGQGKEELGKRLLKFFFQSLINSRTKPKAIILINTAVHLAAENSELLGKLTILEEQGIKILVCVISADEYGVENRIKVGSVADMDAICEQILSAWKVITL